MTQRILLVEDDIELAEMIQGYLQYEGYSLDHAADGDQAVARICNDPPDMIILDIMLPGKDGMEIVQTIRPDYTGPIIMLTAKGDDLVEANSLNCGADAFLQKPVRPHVLLAHVRAHFRRHFNSVSAPGSADNAHQDHGLAIDTGRYEARLDDKLLALTSKEFELLAYLYERKGQLVSRDELYLALKCKPYDGMDRSLDMQISTLRKKMDDENPPYRYIKTIRGQGYLLSK
ncbi:MAG: response regulator transcription factor [Gammaproteobacteria bacterium]|nr:response regulator transcription factor [Gammaproteobacteria bacterium]